jgi:hypothetical protein
MFRKHTCISFKIQYTIWPEVPSFGWYCKITYFRWDFISHFCHIVSLQQSKICIYWRVVINRKPFKYFHIRWFYFCDHYPHENKTQWCYSVETTTGPNVRRNRNSAGHATCLEERVPSNQKHAEENLQGLQHMYPMRHGWLMIRPLQPLLHLIQ